MLFWSTGGRLYWPTFFASRTCLPWPHSVPLLWAAGGGGRAACWAAHAALRRRSFCAMGRGAERRLARPHGRMASPTTVTCSPYLSAHPYSSVNRPFGGGITEREVHMKSLLDTLLDTPTLRPAPPGGLPATLKSVRRMVDSDGLPSSEIDRRAAKLWWRAKSTADRRAATRHEASHQV